MIGKYSALIGLSCLPSLAVTHHSVAGTFDTDTVIEREGEVTEILWRNPHVRFTISATTGVGQEELWEIEMTSLSTLRRRKLSADFLQPGDRVKLAGSPAKDGGNQMYVRNILLPSGEELVLQNTAEPRWSDRVLGTSQQAREGDSSAPELGIFRVWSTPIRGGDPIWNSRYPLTAAAQASVAAFDPAVDSPTLNCAPKGMPTIMEQPYPMEILDQTEKVVIHMEEYNTLRTIHMGEDSADRDPTVPRLGHSVGDWEDGTLVITTTGIGWPHFDRDGIPLSPAANIVEQFTPSADGSRLDYKMTLTDPVNFTEPVVLDKYWLWFPEVTVEPYGCTVSG